MLCAFAQSIKHEDGCCVLSPGQGICYVDLIMARLSTPEINRAFFRIGILMGWDQVFRKFPQDDKSRQQWTKALQNARYFKILTNRSLKFIDMPRSDV